MKTIWAARALLPEGWAFSVLIQIDETGRIARIGRDAERHGECVDLLLPAPANLHSHAFQRAMAGLAEARGPQAGDDNSHDSFWTWRDIMYRFLARLGPEDVESIAAFAQMEMLEAGFAAVAEFHYLHHQPDGTPYDDIAEMAAQIGAAAATTGIGLTLLPVLYQQGGTDGRALAGGQRRFGNDLDQYARLVDTAAAALGSLPRDTVIGAAIHSLRAVPPDGITACAALRPDAPVHIHIAEQPGEIVEITNAYGARPVAWLLANQTVDGRWCLVHATHMTAEETTDLAASGAVAGLCPITEANLGDGIFDGVRYIEAGGKFGVGSDSNVRISLTEELRLLEYSQRLKHQSRALLTTAQQSTGRFLLEQASAGGAQASGRGTGVIAPGEVADLLALDTCHADFAGRDADALLDSFIFCAGDSAVSDVWAAGRHLVTGGRHIRRDDISARYASTMRNLQAEL